MTTITIVGDSFTQYYEDTYLEKICKSLDLEVLDHVGFPGGDQFKIYLRFLQQLEMKPNIMFCCITGYDRIYHPKFPVQRLFDSVTFKFLKVFNSKTIKEDIPEYQLVMDAAQKYYEHLYDDSYMYTMQRLMVTDMQKKCRERNIKMINFPCFDATFLEKTYGLWCVSEPKGLMNLSKLDDPLWQSHNTDKRKNHFSPNGHNSIAEEIIPHINELIKSTDEDFFRISFLYPHHFK